MSTHFIENIKICVIKHLPYGIAVIRYVCTTRQVLARTDVQAYVRWERLIIKDSETIQNTTPGPLQPETPRGPQQRQSTGGTPWQPVSLREREMCQRLLAGNGPLGEEDSPRARGPEREAFKSRKERSGFGKESGKTNKKGVGSVRKVQARVCKGSIGKRKDRRR